jgi:16S rRNA (guanine966-N2)-methyltransferase
MRVIAGSLKGRRLKTPTWEGLRPTSDKLRETLFNILSPRLSDARVLDGYAGTGALGIEAISRGARAATFVDDDRRAQALIAENTAHCGIENLCVIIRTTVLRALEVLQARSSFEPFDIVLLDPPYAPKQRGSLDVVLQAAGAILAPDGVVVLEHARRAAVPDTAGILAHVRRVDSGDSALSFYERR